jgi:hypothetical protein
MPNHPGSHGLGFVGLSNEPFQRAQVYSFAPHVELIRHQFDLLISNKAGACDCENYFSKWKLTRKSFSPDEYVFHPVDVFSLRPSRLQKNTGIGKSPLIKLKIGI